ncbi:arsenic resistance protein ArsB [Sulfolobus acidocaldarius SUSAZ]|nr:arsenic resistance protein ArsB [Sulfolobus acidocaldarius SUSAZ]
MEYIALIIGIITYGLIISRSIIRVPLWASMFFGGILMIVTGVITLQEAYSSVNLDVILFLMTLFMFSSALEVSGFLKFLAYKLVSRYKDPKKVLFYILFYAGILSNLVTNDGISSSWTPVVLEASKAMKVDELPFLYALAFGVTIGSVMMPTGNPQNLLILLESNTPFLIFVAILLIPTMINFIISYFVLLLIFRKKLSNITVDDNLGNIQIQNKRLAYSSLILLAITIILFFVLSIYRIDIVLASLVTSSILLLVNKERREIIQKVDWSVIVFFIGLFIFTEGLVKGGIMDALYHIVPLPTNTATIMASSVVLSQILSNVPLVAIYIQEMQKLGAVSILNWLALAAGSTIAGNFTILGAASNVIVSEASESRGGKGFSFLEFMKYALPILAVNFVVLYLFISFVGTILIQLLTAFH